MGMFFFVALTLRDVLRFYSVFFYLCAYVLGLLLPGRFYLIGFLVFFVFGAVLFWRVGFKFTLIFSGFFILFFIFGVYRIQQVLPAPMATSPHYFNCYGRIDAMPVLSDKRYQFRIITDQKKRLQCTAPMALFRQVPSYGDRFEFYGYYFPPEPNRNPSLFDAVTYYKIHRLAGSYRIQDLSYLGGRRFCFKFWGYILKQKIITNNRRILPQLHADMLTALVFGLSGLHLNAEVTALFQKTGCVHLLVVSGAQVVLITLVVTSLLRYLRVRAFTILVLMTFLQVFFYGITGGGPSLFRAIIMNEVVLLLSCFKIKSSSLHVLAFSAFAVLLYEPLWLWDVGAHLSFLATAALIFGAPAIRVALPKRIPLFISGVVAITLAPLLFTMPLLWYVFHQLSLAAFIANLMALVLIEGIIVIGFFSSLIGVIWFPFVYVFILGNGYVLQFFYEGINYLSQWDCASLVMPAPPLWFVLVLYFFIVFFILTADRMIRSVIIGAFFILFFTFIFFRPSSLLRVTFLDVGQGDAILIQTPRHHAFLIDTGGAETPDTHFYTARDTIVPALQAYGINELACVLITHCHDDHSGGLDYLVKHVAIRTLMDTGNQTLYSCAAQQWIKKNDSRYYCIAGYRTLKIEDDVFLTFFYPFSLSKSASRALICDENNRSMIVKLSYHNVDFLFMGDLKSDIEMLLIDRYGHALESEIIKCGHHGSMTSTSEAFLDVVKPKIAVISVGAHNLFGHPSSVVLKRLNQRRIHCFRTDKHGAIVVSTDGTQLFYKTYR